ncbi:hypothetical protein HYR99_24260, partial [Candidatus Poribacteria bacterium]|nr:hypothetical protein [Candidatus Poribacteria bacterium]
MPINNSVESTAERHEIDPVLKEVLTKHLGPLNLTIQTQVEVSRLPRTIDALVILKSPGQRKRVQSETVFRHFRIYNVIEFKGKGDPLTLWKYRLIVGRANLYLGEKKISASKMTVTIISARRPTQVLENCPEDVRWETIGSGHYRSTDLLPVHLFVCDELEIEPKNYPLLLFAASKEKLRQFFERIVEEDNDLYIHYAHFADYDLIEEVLKMAGKQSQYEKTLKRLAKDYGPILLSALTPEERVRGLQPEERVRGLQPEERVRGLQPEERVRGLQPEERVRGL